MQTGGDVSPEFEAARESWWPVVRIKELGGFQNTRQRE